jgi:hypothetical protein
VVLVSTERDFTRQTVKSMLKSSCWLGGYI